MIYFYQILDKIYFSNYFGFVSFLKLSLFVNHCIVTQFLIYISITYITDKFIKNNLGKTRTKSKSLEMIPWRLKIQMPNQSSRHRIAVVIERKPFWDVFVNLQPFFKKTQMIWESHSCGRIIHSRHSLSGIILTIPHWHPFYSPKFCH